ncbi:uncharacterized protein L969DRAFT_95980 [Mixia osmundae IAM 14324]|uniref:Histidine kinase n=1 Tax=Mixia osmundae (strain CBS 9802 / IAM 14324 / JCM 22182 / KY 12970) TaxID=764103 RepID=G7DWU7_MIXOS|nr:uncharacterized protein L969DRAFT_20538 [Mixia osmundae IAM 14324]XP_014566710.1 uncharacterized protein L969DRAFT_95980 [Mixia osmundae IAM 14324]KEI36179.1 hypothetical protein L969DRAFT_20538 [Mixia osmundae IAM 14324]KEI38147.1 hypothetical protein L969DRAFT_95980 [Mixia osmundae IAM 14324]GAA95044.1 hypothetical protein E5Q_01699 [Mixia osmundae IAM 14324]
MSTASAMADLLDEPRLLHPKFDPSLVVLSFFVSWLGAYTTTQLIANHYHALHTKGSSSWLWLLGASVTFGGCGIFCLHFLGMLACRFDVNVTFEPFTTVMSAVVAVLFTFAALSSNVFRHLRLKQWTRYIKARLNPQSASQDDQGGDLESQRPLIGHKSESSGSEDGDRMTETSRSHSNYTAPDDDPEEALVERGRLLDEQEERLANGHSSHSAMERPAPRPLPTLARLSGSDSSISYSTPSSKPSSRPSRRESSDSIKPALVDATPSHSLQRIGSDGSHGSGQRGRSRQRPSAHSSNSSDSAARNETTDPSEHTSDQELRLPSHVKARLKRRANNGDSEHDWKEDLLDDLRRGFTLGACMRALLWALAVFTMHYQGMAAMRIDHGFIEWRPFVIVLSFIVAYVVTLVATVWLPSIEVSFFKQIAFSFTAATGVASMHYTGQHAAIFYSYSPPQADAGYPPALPFAITVVAILTCVVFSAVLAHSATTARNRLAETVWIKRRMWRALAASEVAEQAQALQKNFLVVASHELRTPLSTVTGYTELLLRTDLTEEQLDFLGNIRQACHSINLIAGNVLDFSKLERGNSESSARPVQVAIRKLLESLGRMTVDKNNGQPVGLQKGVDVIVVVAEDVPDTLFLDETYALRIIMNLLSNALKATSAGFVLVDVSRSADNLLVKVVDSGCGIPASFRSSIFEPFRQADATYARRFYGSGLGLSIVRQLVERMSGKIEVSSTEGKGSTFSVTLPVTFSTDNRQEEFAERGPRTNRCVVSCRDERTQELVIELLTRLGFPASALSPDATVESLAQESDIIWTDTQSLAAAPVLLEFLAQKRKAVFVVVHDSDPDTIVGDKDLHATNRVILIKRPTVLHLVVKLLEDPDHYLGQEIETTAMDSLPARSVRFLDSTEEATATAEPHVALSTSPEDRPDRLIRPPVDRTPSKTKGLVLLAEDNPINQRLMSRIITRLGWSCRTADNGQIAVELAITDYYHCVLMDLSMPLMSGFEATQLIRAKERSGELQGRLPILALTANVTTESETACKAVGMDDFLTKPVSLQELSAALTRHARPDPGI